MRSLASMRYAPDTAAVRVDVSDNTNAWGMPPAVSRAIASASLSPRYPSAYSDALKAAISRYLGVPLNAIATGCGSDDILDAAFRAFATAEERIAFPTPTFTMVPVFASLNGAVPTPTALEDLTSSDARVIYLCSPNNPTGSVIPRADIERVLRATRPGQYVIVDEAYAEFAAESVVDLVGTYEQLVVTRTMSKAFGLAGFRVGYAIAAPAVVEAIEASRGPYNVSTLSEVAAVAALDEGIEWMRQYAALAVETRERLASELTSRGIPPLPSAANFVFVPMPNAIAIATAMLRLGVRVRGFADPSGLRINVGPWPMMQDVLSALDEARR